MHIVYGAYKFKPKRVAYKRDYCLTCEAVRLIERVRTLDFIHIYWIPLIPIGYIKRWHCITCNSNPSARVKTSKWLLWTFVPLAFVMGIIMAIGAITSPAHSEDRLGFTIAASLVLTISIVLVFAIKKYKSGPNLKLARQNIQPSDPKICPFCNSNLTKANEIQLCTNCNIERLG